MYTVPGVSSRMVALVIGSSLGRRRRPAPARGGVVGAGGVFGGVKAAEMALLAVNGDGGGPLATAVGVAVNAFVASGVVRRKAAVELVLGVGGQAQVLAAVVELVAVDVVDQLMTAQ